MLKCKVIVQEGEVYSNSRHGEPQEKSSARVAAIVDRTADVVNAAMAIGISRTAYRGSSPYAPDIVLVNEFLADDFLVHLVQAISSYKGDFLTNQRPAKGHLQAVKEFENNESIRVIMSGANGSVVEMRNR
jgi:acyl-CoA reductase-like NAD-dependent aldehyde dehydrogenase